MNRFFVCYEALVIGKARERVSVREESFLLLLLLSIKTAMFLNVARLVSDYLKKASFYICCTLRANDPQFGLSLREVVVF
jgi:hypothetical protein